MCLSVIQVETIVLFFFLNWRNEENVQYLKDANHLTRCRISTALSKWHSSTTNEWVLKWDAQSQQMS